MKDSKEVKVERKITKEYIINFLVSQVSFEKGIDLSDETAVLYRRNVVIKNILWLTNLLYTGFLFILSFANPDLLSNWIFSILFLPITFGFSTILKKVAFNNECKNDLLRQQIAMYLQSFYIIGSAILMYSRLKTGSDFDVGLGEAGYMLLYYGIVLISLYQNTDLLKMVYLCSTFIIISIHVLITYDLNELAAGLGKIEFIKEFLSSAAFWDIFLRFAIMGLFMLVVYTICRMGEFLADERKKEIDRRASIQTDYVEVVGDLFDALIVKRVEFDSFTNEVKLLGNMSSKLASYYGFTPEQCREVYDYALFLSENEKRFNLNIKADSEEEQFNELRIQSNLGKELVRRIELSQKSKNIVTAQVFNVTDDELYEKLRSVQNDIEKQIISIVDIYIILRSLTSFKRPFSHSRSIEIMKDALSQFFDSRLFDRFLKFSNEFENMFDEFEEIEE